MLDEKEITSIISNELRFSTGIVNLAESLDYYLGNPRGDEVEGRSEVVSQDVGDVIEWILPQVMKNLLQPGEVVTFDPIGPEDEEQAELESFYVHDALLKQNNGYLEIQQIVKDALMQRNGILKVYSNDRPQYNLQFAQPQDELQAQILHAQIQASGGEIIATDEETGEIVFKQPFVDNRPKVYSVAPEDFQLNMDHNSVDLRGARFQCEIITKTASDWLALGYDQEIIDDVLGNYAYTATHRQYRFGAQDEPLVVPVNPMTDDSQRIITCGECYVRLDLYECGIATLYKALVVLNGTGASIHATHLLELQPVDMPPYIGVTAILMTHKFQGLSIYDRLKSIQDQMTALLRSNLDNIYYTNNGRLQVQENLVNMDDLLYSVPGGLVRVKQIGAVTPIETPQIGQNAFSMMEHLQNVRTGRTGVTPEGAVQPHKVGDRVGSEAINNIMTAKEELVGLMIRNFAELLMAPACLRLRDLLRATVTTTEQYKLRGTWKQTNPSQWPERTKTTIRCGTGSGDKTFKITALSQIIQYQQTALQMPGQTLVSPLNVYKALDELSKAFGLTGAARYFMDPQSPDGQAFAQQVQQQMQQQQQQQMQQQQVELKAMADVAAAEHSKAITAQQNVVLKAQNEQQKQQLEELKQQLEVMKNKDELQLKYDELEAKTTIEIMKLQATAQEFEAIEDEIENDD